MNLRELLERRAERGTQIGSTTLMNRIEAELNYRRFSFASPGMGFAAAAVVTLLVVGGVLLALRPDSEPAPPADTSTTTTTLAPQSTTTTTSADPTAGMELSDWIGTYSWTESVEGPGSNQTLVHDLYLEAADGAVLTGYLTQNGYQTDRYVPINAVLADEHLAIFATEGVGPYTTDTPLFRLSGDPGQPSTNLDQLVTLQLNIAREGLYFAPPSPDTGEADIRQYVWNYDPATGDPEQLRAALQLYDGHPYGLIRLVATGDQATRDLIFDHLKQPSAWNVQTLALMQRYGTPGETQDESEPWPGDVKWAIFSALQEAGQATFGEQADFVVDLQLEVAKQELDLCAEEPGGCNYGASWYAVPQVVTSIDGQGSGNSFTGSMNIVSDTGAGGSMDFVALRTDEGWALQEGYRAKTPYVAFMGPDSLVVTAGELQLWGYADPRASLSLAGRPIASDLQSGYWVADVWDTPPEPGTHEIVITATLDGETNTDSVTLRYEPAAVEQFAFIKGIDTSGAEPALIVDYAEFLSGEEAVQAAIEDGELPADQADEGLPNDFYIRNNNPQLRTLPLAGDAVIYLFDYTVTGEFDYDPMSVENLVRAALSGDESAYYFSLSDYPVWLVVKDEVILQVTPQYLP